MVKEISEEVFYMDLCIKMAKRGKSPFGSIIVKDGEIIGVGSVIRKCGKKRKQYHAERVAIENANSDTRGATLYTTLEPCSIDNYHYLSCSSLISIKGIKRVVIGMIDTNPWICGDGIYNLINKGVDVSIFKGLEKKIFYLNKKYFLKSEYDCFNDWYEKYMIFFEKIIRDAGDKIEIINLKE